MKNGAFFGTFIAAFTFFMSLPLAGYATPPFINSVVSIDEDFIYGSDPGPTFEITSLGTATREMPDKLSDDLFKTNVLQFDVRYSDGTGFEVLGDPAIGTPEAIEDLINIIGEAGAKLPERMRSILRHIVVNAGDLTAFAEDKGRFFVLYDDNVRLRTRQGKLEETMFHESVHATLDHPYASSVGWRQAQEKDAQFLTAYAESRPNAEDLAETALFAYLLFQHPGRLDPTVEATVRQTVPHRLAYLSSLFSSLGLLKN